MMWFHIDMKIVSVITSIEEIKTEASNVTEVLAGALHFANVAPVNRIIHMTLYLFHPY